MCYRKTDNTLLPREHQLALELLDDQAFDRIVELIERPPVPTEALRELMRGHQ